MFYTLVYGIYLWVFASDPGVVSLEGPQTSHLNVLSSSDPDPVANADLEQPSVPSRSYCNTCGVFTSPEIAHCVACNVCIRDIDHHCVAFGKCIARRNMPAFRLMLGGVVLSIVALYIQGFQTFRAGSP